MTLSFFVRLNAFWLPHYMGDQLQYAVLAMKISSSGLSDYTLRHVSQTWKTDPRDPSIEMSVLGLKDGPGDLIESLRAVGQGYYDEPLHMRAPLFPWILSLSHRLFARDDDFSVCMTNLGSKVFSKKPWFVFKDQFWAAIVPFGFSLAAIACVFFAAYFFFGLRAATFAGLIFAANPVGLLSAHRLLAEDMLVFFAAAALFLYYWALEKENRLAFLCSGALCGLAVLTKQRALVLLPIVGLYGWVRHSKAGFMSSIRRAGFVLFALGFLVVTFFWFWKVFRQYGTPLYIPLQQMVEARAMDTTGWFKSIQARPISIFFFTVCLVGIVPAFIFVFLGIPEALKKCAKALSPEGTDFKIVFLWIWFVVVFAEVTRPWFFLKMYYNQENRYLYIAYPALALIAAHGLERVRGFVAKRIGSGWIADVLVLVFLGLSAWGSITAAMKVILTDVTLL